MRTMLLYPYTKGGVSGPYPPISILYLASAIQQAGEDVMVIDIDDGNISDKEILKKLDEYKPHLVGIPLFSSHLAIAYDLVSLIKSTQPDCKIVLGGPHATVRPEQVLETFSGCDYVLRGESEGSIVELIKSMVNGTSLESIRGLSYKQDSRISHNPDVVLNTDLDTIALPARELLAGAYKRNTYWRIGHRGASDVIITSRGCPSACNFCFKVAKRFRVRSPENILEELEYIKSQGISNVHVMDDLFVYEKDRCLKILDLIKKHKLNMKFKVRARVDTIDKELLLALKDAGVTGVVFGIESGSQKILDAMNKRTTVEMNYRAIALTKKVGLQCYADVFIGYPPETPETIKETEKLILQAKPTSLSIGVMYPLPGTTIYKQAKEQGTLRNDWDINNSRVWIKLPWIENAKTLDDYENEIRKKFLCKPSVYFNAIRFALVGINFQRFKKLVAYFIKNTLLYRMMVNH